MDTQDFDVDAKSEVNKCNSNQNTVLVCQQRKEEKMVVVVEVAVP